MLARICSISETSDQEKALLVAKKSFYILKQSLSDKHKNDQAFDTLAYLCLKHEFKQELLADGEFLRDLIESRLTEGSSWAFQSFVFIILNLVRDKFFDKIPSFSLKAAEKSKEMDISYYELKELERSISRGNVDIVGHLNSEFINEYGEDTTEIKRQLLSTQLLKLLSTQSPLRKWLLNEAGVLSLKMVSESLLGMATVTKFVGQMV